MIQASRLLNSHSFFAALAIAVLFMAVFRSNQHLRANSSTKAALFITVMISNALIVAP